MIIKALYTFAGLLDLSSQERLYESNPLERIPFRLCIRPGESVVVDEKFYSLISIQNALRLGYIQIGNIPGLNKTLVDMSYSGTIITQTAGENISRGDVVYYKDDGKVYRAKADMTATMICMGIATESAAANKTIILLVDGLIRNSSVFNLTTGGQAGSNNAIVYVSETDYGKITQTRSTISTHIVQIIGYAITSDILNFKPDSTYIEID